MSEHATVAPPARALISADGLPAAFLLALLATAGLFYVNIMPAIVAGLGDGLGFSPRESGLVGSANIYGAAGGALTAVFLVRKLPWRGAQLILLSLLIAVDILSIFVVTPVPLIALRFVHGLIGGMSVGIALAIIARTAAPDRNFGVLLLLQYGLGGLGVMALPPLVPLFGAQVLFLALAAISLLALIGLSLLPAYPPRAVQVRAHGRAIPAPMAGALAALFLFQAANMGLGAYVIELGRAYELTQGFIGPALGIASWVGMLGALLVVLIGAKFSRVWPLAAAMAVTIAGTFAFHGSANGMIYAAANMATAVVWAFVVPFLFGICAEFDSTGRSAAIAGFCSKLGLASGPALSAFLLADVGYDGLINLACLLLGLSAVAALWAASATERLRNSPETP